MVEEEEGGGVSFGSGLALLFKKLQVLCLDDRIAVMLSGKAA